MLAIAVWASGAWADDRADFSDAYRSYEQHLAANDTERALEAAKQAHRLGSKVFGKNSVNAAKLAINYAALLNDVGQYRRARKTLDGKLEVLEAHYGSGATELVPMMMQLARAAKTPDGALEHFRRAARLSKGYDDDLIEAQKNYEIMSILLRQGGRAFIEPYVDRTYEIYSEWLEPNDFRLGLMSYHKAQWATARDHHDQALGYLVARCPPSTTPNGNAWAVLSEPCGCRWSKRWRNSAKGMRPQSICSYWERSRTGLPRRNPFTGKPRSSPWTQ